MSSRSRTYCCSLNCSNERHRDIISMFRFPKDKERCKRWIINTRRQDLMDYDSETMRHKGFQLCASHFEDSQFMNAQQRNKLVWNAIPTLFDVPNPPKRIEIKRKLPTRHPLPPKPVKTNPKPIITSINSTANSSSLSTPRFSTLVAPQVSASTTTSPRMVAIVTPQISTATTTTSATSPRMIAIVPPKTTQTQSKMIPKEGYATIQPALTGGNFLNLVTQKMQDKNGHVLLPVMLSKPPTCAGAVEIQTSVPTPTNRAGIHVLAPPAPVTIKNGTPNAAEKSVRSVQSAVTTANSKRVLNSVNKAPIQVAESQAVTTSTSSEPVYMFDGKQIVLTNPWSVEKKQRASKAEPRQPPSPAMLLLRKKLRQKSREAQRLRLKFTKLKEQNKELKTTVNALKPSSANVLSLMKDLGCIPQPYIDFTRLQIKVAHHKKGAPFPHELRVFALMVYNSSRQVYNYLKRSFALPQNRSMMRWMKALRESPDFTSDVFKDEALLSSMLKKLGAQHPDPKDNPTTAVNTNGVNVQSLDGERGNEVSSKECEQEILHEVTVETISAEPQIIIQTTE